MTKKRTVRERQKNRQHELDRQRLYKVLAGLDLFQFLDTKKWFKQHILSFPFRDPQVTIAPGLEDTRPLVDDYLCKTFRGLEFREIVRYAMPFIRTVEVNGVGGEAVRACVRVGEEFQNAEIEALGDLYAQCTMHSSFTTGPVVVDRGFKRNLTVDVDRMEPEISKVKLQAGWRQIYRVLSFEKGGKTHHPVPTLACRPGSSERLPVYLQEHAIRRLYDRLDVPNLQPMLPTLAGHCLVGQEPVLYRGRHLVPVDMPGGCRLGYFVMAEADPGLVGVTFLFLTMDGTPEGDKFQRRLRFRRADTEYNGLDRLSTFIDSDLSVNQRVRELIGDLGGLMDFAVGMQDLDSRTKKAVSLLSYLGMGCEG